MYYVQKLEIAIKHEVYFKILYEVGSVCAQWISPYYSILWFLKMTFPHSKIPKTLAHSSILMQWIPANAENNDISNGI